jgi:MoxR-like ATPase
VGTQNHELSIGTYPLPESQLDRFMMRISLGHPSRQAQKELLMGESRLTLIDRLESSLSPDRIIELQNIVETVHVSNPVIEYILNLADAAQTVAKGFSTRTSIALKNAAKAWAYIDGRDYVAPEDIQKIFTSVVAHRLRSNNYSASNGESITRELLSSIAIP